MEVNIRQLHGVWDLGYSLDKHTISSTPIGYNDWRHMQFDTIRPEAGEALFQLKYRSDFTQVSVIASQMHKSFFKYFASANFIIPIPASKQRPKQPVTEIARELSRLMKIPCYEKLLIKQTNTPPVKDIANTEDKVVTLMSAFNINDKLDEGLYNVLIVDDLYDTGSTLEAATNILRDYSKIRNIYVSTVTRKR